MRSFVVASVIPVALFKGEICGTIEVVEGLSKYSLSDPVR